MQHKHHINYSTDGTDGTKDCRINQATQSNEMKRLGFSSTMCSRSDIIKTPFYDESKSILDFPRGGGYWLWKPYLILQKLKSIPEGDTLLYTDSDLSVGNIEALEYLHEYALCNGIAIVYAGPFHNSSHVKRNCLEATGLVGNRTFLEDRQVWAGIGIYKSCKDTLNFVERWLELCKTGTLVTDAPSYSGPEVADFFWHSHDQAILTSLLFSYGIKPIDNKYANAFIHPPY